MNSLFFTRCCALLACCCFCIHLSAQAEMPRKSPRASLNFQVGLTKVDIHYSAPAARGRKIWGGVVPYDRIWRAGANEATTVAFGTNVLVKNQTLPAGKYSLFLIPQEKGDWTVIFNRNTELWGEYDYKQTEDAIRVKLPAEKIRLFDERLAFTVSDEGIDAGYIRLSWAGRQLRIPFRVNLEEELKKAIDRALAEYSDEEDYQAYGEAADFLMTSKDHLRQAMDYVDRSLAMFQHSWNYWIKAQIFAEMGDYKKAVDTARKSMEIGAREEDGYFPLVKALIERSVSEWNKKS